MGYARRRKPIFTFIQKVLAVIFYSGSFSLFSQISTLKLVCLPSINSCEKAAAKCELNPSHLLWMGIPFVVVCAFR